MGRGKRAWKIPSGFQCIQMGVWERLFWIPVLGFLLFIGTCLVTHALSCVHSFQCIQMGVWERLFYSLSESRPIPGRGMVSGFQWGGVHGGGILSILTQYSRLQIWFIKIIKIIKIKTWRPESDYFTLLFYSLSEFILNPVFPREEAFYESMELNLFWIPGSPI